MDDGCRMNLHVNLLGDGRVWSTLQSLFFWVWFVNVFADEGTGSGPSKFWLHFATKLCCSGLFLVQLGASIRTKLCRLKKKTRDKALR